MFAKSYKDLTIWQKAVELAKKTYKACMDLPRSERFILEQQMKRAAISISSNIAEGKQRRSKQEFIHFLKIADGSLGELESQIHIASELYTEINFSNLQKDITELQKMLGGFLRKL